MILDRDAFTIEYDATLTSLEDMYTAITALGYSPSLAGGRLPNDENSNQSAKPPEIVAAALNTAAAESKLVFVDFFAEWCIACKALEQTTLADAQVVEALSEYVVLKLDTDLHPETAVHYNIVGMPTLLVLNAEGTEVFRSVGPITVQQLSAKLQELQTD